MLRNYSENDNMNKNDVSKIRNAFELMFESNKGGNIRSITPKRKKGRKKVARIGTPKSAAKDGNIGDWFRRMSKNNE